MGWIITYLDLRCSCLHTVIQQPSRLCDSTTWEQSWASFWGRSMVGEAQRDEIQRWSGQRWNKAWGKRSLATPESLLPHRVSVINHQSFYNTSQEHSAHLLFLRTLTLSISLSVVSSSRSTCHWKCAVNSRWLEMRRSYSPWSRKSLTQHQPVIDQHNFINASAHPEIGRTCEWFFCNIRRVEELYLYLSDFV